MQIKLPIKDEIIKKLTSGTKVYLNGILYAARDAAHKRIIEAVNKKEKLPLDLKGAVIYYMGPSPAPPGKVIGSCGPTTSGRMDIYTIPLLKLGLKGMIGKGARSQEVKEALKKYKAVYLAAIGGAGALISKSIKEAKILAYEDLGAEALMQIKVENFFAIVINDIYGGDLYEEGKKQYQIFNS
ncbi:MAG: Fe-S-containing hydro-lyase [Armatimonadetes bacterium]|nr:Fe-S-containing hydro-lyase [Armatimonadota bacterium]